MHTSTLRRHAALALTAPALLLAAACGLSGDSAPTVTPAPTATPLPAPTLTVTNDTPCIVHVYFDNQPQTSLGRINPGQTQTFTEERLRDWSYMSIESTMAIFRKYDMEQVRDDGYVVTVRPGIGDNPCTEQ